MPSYIYIFDFKKKSNLENTASHLTTVNYVFLYKIKTKIFLIFFYINYYIIIKYNWEYFMSDYQTVSRVVYISICLYNKNENYYVCLWDKMELQ